MPTKAKKIAGWVLHVLIAALIIMAGVFKLVKMNDPEMAAEMAKSGLEGKVALVGAGEAIAAVLLLIPRTSSLGLLLVSGFWGGVIATHMTQGKEFISGSVFLALTWLAAYLRDPRAFYSFQSEPKDPLA